MMRDYPSPADSASANFAEILPTFVERWEGSPFGRFRDHPWHFTQDAERYVLAALDELDEAFQIEDGIAIHRSAIVEPSAVLKGPIIIGPRCFVAATAYLRGGAFLDEECIVGPSCELKSSFMFKGAKIAHLNFVGDSILGIGVNVEAGAIILEGEARVEQHAAREPHDGRGGGASGISRSVASGLP
jgi:NDP-sugar pyrophosphorylase family protein